MRSGTKEALNLILRGKKVAVLCPSHKYAIIDYIDPVLAELTCNPRHKIKSYTRFGDLKIKFSNEAILHIFTYGSLPNDARGIQFDHFIDDTPVLGKTDQTYNLIDVIKFHIRTKKIMNDEYEVEYATKNKDSESRLEKPAND